MINGTIDNDGNVEICFNLQADMLRGPDENGEKRYYLPCCTCGDLQLVKENVVATECDDCYNIENDDYETNMLLRKGY